MDNPMLQLIILAGIVIFLILRLRSVLGTRDGFEKPAVMPGSAARERDGVVRDFEVIDGGPDHDIVDHVPEGSDAARALTAMKRVEPSFHVSDFLGGARGAYEMILMSFERGDLDEIAPFLADDIRDTFAEVIAAREAQGLTIEAEFIGVRELTLVDATFDEATRQGEVTVKFVGELTSVVRNAEGEVIEGSATTVKRQKDIWTFGREMGSADPNWQLVATDA